MKKEFNLFGSANIVKISTNSNYIIVCDYAGGMAVFGMKEDKLIFKTRVKGSRRYLPVHYCDFSFDNRYVAFSCIFKIIVVDLQQKKIIKELEYSIEEELQPTVSFCFYKTQNKLLFPNGRTLTLYDIDNDNFASIPLPENAGVSNQLAIDWDDKTIAYKSWKEAYRDKLFLIDADTFAVKEILLPYPKSHSQLYMCMLKFTTNGQIVVLRKGEGFSYFDTATTTEIKTISWEDLGFRSFHNYKHSRISNCGRYLLVHKEKPDKYDITEWYVSVPEGMDHVVYDTENKKIIHKVKKNETAADFNSEYKIFAYINTDKETRKETLVLETINI